MPDRPGSAYLFVLPWSLEHVGGVNQVVINLAREMVRSGSFRPVVLITDWNSVNPAWETVQGIETVRWRIRTCDSRATIKQRIAFEVWKTSFVPAFRGFCAEEHIKVINQHYAGPAAFTLQRTVKFLSPDIPLLISFHGADLTTIASGHPETITEWKQLLTQVKAVVACSGDLGRKIASTFGTAVTPAIIYNGIDSAGFAALAGDGTPSSRRVVLSVGKFEEKKGQDILIRAFAELVREYDDIDLILIGGSGPTLPKLREFCAEREIEDRVRFFADVPHAQVAPFFKMATVFVLPSRQEPFGIVILEAGSVSLPVVASNVGGIPEIITDGVTGCLVPKESSDALANALRALLDDPERAKAMGDRLKSRLATTFTWTAAHEHYIRLLSQ